MPTKRRITAPLLAFAFALALAAGPMAAPSALAQDAQPAPQTEAPSLSRDAIRGVMGPLTTILPARGVSGPWQVEMTPRGFLMGNRTEANAVRYFYVDAGKEAGSRRVEVDVIVEPQGPRTALAGLLYGFNKETKSYFMLVIEGGDRVALYARTPKEMRRIVGLKFESNSRGPYRLAIQEQGDQFEMSLNGNRLGAVKFDAVGKGATGIVAAGLGTFGFAAFNVTDAPGDGGTAIPERGAGEDAAPDAAPPKEPAPAE